MRVQIKNTIKDAIMVDIVDNEVKQTPTRLNAGMAIKASHVQELDNGAVNIHLTDSSTLLGIPRRDIEFCSIENERTIEELTNPNDPDPAPAPGPDGRKKIKRRRCCGGG